MRLVAELHAGEGEMAEAVSFVLLVFMRVTEAYSYSYHISAIIWKSVSIQTTGAAT